MSAEKIFTYPTSLYRFQETMKTVLGVPGDLRQAHTLIESSIHWNQIEFQNDTSTDFHKLYYKSPQYSQMISLYHRFLQEWLLPQLDEKEDEFIVQKEPSFRIHIPNNTALGKRGDEVDSEKIGFHCDSDYNHPAAEMNYMLTITGQQDTNSCYVETEPGKEDFHPIAMSYGDVFRFYGNKCRHYNMKNRTNHTRISLDFRVIPASQYVETEGEAVHSGRKFVVGGYYIRMKKLTASATPSKEA